MSRIVDVDFRAQTATTVAIAPYLGEAWRKFVGVDGSYRGTWQLPETIFQAPSEGLSFAGTSYMPTKAVAAIEGDARVQARERLDRHGIELAVVNPGTAAELSAVANPYLAAEVARATNDWLVTEWLAADDRFLGCLIVSTTDPKRAAAEIRRHGGNERIAQVAFAYPLALLGSKYLRPILEAANECRLVVYLQAGGAYAGQNRGLTAVGHPSTIFEHEVGWTSAAQPHLSSAIAEGAFERFPDLRLLLGGYGIAWLPSLLWSMDAAFESERIPRPVHSTTRPSEAVGSFVRFTTTAVELPRERERLAALLSLVRGEELLVYASGVETAGPPAETLADFPADWRQRIAAGNADELYGTAQSTMQRPNSAMPSSSSSSGTERKANRM